MAYSSAAYCPIERVAAWGTDFSPGCSSATSSFSSVQTFEAKSEDGTRSFFGYVGLDTARSWVVAAFKGTNTTADYTTDLNGGYWDSALCVVDGVDLGNVHGGFCEFWSRLNEAGFGQALAQTAAAHPTYRLLFTGHSLGAAVATVAAAFVAVKHPNLSGRRLSVYTLGSPRVGDFGFSHGVFGKRVFDSWRVVHSGDVVTHEPPCCASLLGRAGCLRTANCPYHTKREVWYRGGMPPAAAGYRAGNGSGGNPPVNASAYTICKDAEDPSCNAFEGMDIQDHLIYFNEKVGSYCCDLL
eukprot:CAMPEP_0171974812 /NCGR_PEP_ID=MMETSP0993-20121228/234242_1 /TAXON_ID=483369 /ORGANISM="non described non described, Strain CCMP2098" /LENGTH=297 /DNA_ID=CAMNT_0012625919 /DNA_START=257 /DNA_END=1150 /DNA_ORIENTATION=+